MGGCGGLGLVCCGGGLESVGGCSSGCSNAFTIVVQDRIVSSNSIEGIFVALRTAAVENCAARAPRDEIDIADSYNSYINLKEVCLL